MRQEFLEVLPLVLLTVIENDCTSVLEVHIYLEKMCYFSKSNYYKLQHFKLFLKLLQIIIL